LQKSQSADADPDDARVIVTGVDVEHENVEVITVLQAGKEPPSTAQKSTFSPRLKKTTSQTNKDYDLKRVRTFQQNWIKQFPWVQHKDGDMTCVMCLKFPNISDPINPFVIGTSTFRINALQSHQQGTKHRRCQDAYDVQVNEAVAPLDVLLKKIPEPVMTKMKKLFNTAYYVARNEKPFSDFSKLCELQNLNGAAMGSTYLNDHGCVSFITAIDEMFKGELKTAIDEASMFSILCDGSTDAGRRLKLHGLLLLFACTTMHC